MSRILQDLVGFRLTIIPVSFSRKYQVLCVVQMKWSNILYNSYLYYMLSMWVKNMLQKYRLKILILPAVVKQPWFVCSN